jgi:D-3-phosphoglycerate dehydrogenase
MCSKERETLSCLEHRLIEIEGENDEEIKSSVSKADAILVVSSYLRSPVVDSLKNCRIISRIGTGVDKIDVEAATHRGIVVNNLPGAFTEEVADHTLAMLLAAARELPTLDRVMRKGCQPGSHSIHRLSTQTVGLVGFGLIGRAVAKRCRAFGLRVMACDPMLTKDDADSAGVVRADWENLLGEADYLCLLCPLLPTTRNMLALPQFRKMKRTAVLINTGRGELVNEDDLATALREGLIRFAALDVFGRVNVFAPNGFATDHDLFKLDNVLLTPHFGAASIEGALECRCRAAHAVVDVLSGRWPEHPVNPNVKTWFPMPAR